MAQDDDDEELTQAQQQAALNLAADGTTDGNSAADDDEDENEQRKQKQQGAAAQKQDAAAGNTDPNATLTDFNDWQPPAGPLADATDAAASEKQVIQDAHEWNKDRQQRQAVEQAWRAEPGAEDWRRIDAEAAGAVPEAESWDEHLKNVGSAAAKPITNLSVQVANLTTRRDNPSPINPTGYERIVGGAIDEGKHALGLERTKQQGQYLGDAFKSAVKYYEEKPARLGEFAGEALVGVATLGVGVAARAALPIGRAATRVPTATGGAVWRGYHAAGRGLAGRYADSVNANAARAPRGRVVFGRQPIPSPDRIQPGAGRGAGKLALGEAPGGRVYDRVVASLEGAGRLSKQDAGRIRALAGVQRYATGRHAKKAKPHPDAKLELKPGYMDSSGAYVPPKDPAHMAAVLQEVARQQRKGRIGPLHGSMNLQGQIRPSIKKQAGDALKAADSDSALNPKWTDRFRRDGARHRADATVREMAASLQQQGTPAVAVGTGPGAQNRAIRIGGQDYHEFAVHGPPEKSPLAIGETHVRGTKLGTGTQTISLDGMKLKAIDLHRQRLEQLSQTTGIRPKTKPGTGPDLANLTDEGRVKDFVRGYWTDKEIVARHADAGRHRQAAALDKYAEDVRKSLPGVDFGGRLGGGRSVSYVGPAAPTRAPGAPSAGVAGAVLQERGPAGLAPKGKPPSGLGAAPSRPPRPSLIGRPGRGKSAVPGPPARPPRPSLIGRPGRGKSAVPGLPSTPPAPGWPGAGPSNVPAPPTSRVPGGPRPKLTPSDVPSTPDNPYKIPTPTPPSDVPHIPDTPPPSTIPDPPPPTKDTPYLPPPWKCPPGHPLCPTPPDTPPPPPGKPPIAPPPIWPPDKPTTRGRAGPAAKAPFLGATFDRNFVGFRRGAAAVRPYTAVRSRELAKPLHKIGAPTVRRAVRAKGARRRKAAASLKVLPAPKKTKTPAPGRTGRRGPYKPRPGAAAAVFGGAGRQGRKMFGAGPAPKKTKTRRRPLKF